MASDLMLSVGRVLLRGMKGRAKGGQQYGMHPIGWVHPRIGVGENRHKACPFHGCARRFCGATWASDRRNRHESETRLEGGAGWCKGGGAFPRTGRAEGPTAQWQGESGEERG